jgi:uncharacterized membrane protein YeaQ/YmgE (transglycosylase-associated protein family)
MRSTLTSMPSVPLISTAPASSPGLWARRRLTKARGTKFVLGEFRRQTDGVISMGLILFLIVGGIIGWLASIAMRSPEGILMNVIVGIVGAIIAGLVINPLIGGGNIMSGNFNAMSLVASFLGAVVLLAIVNLIRRGSVR